MLFTAFTLFHVLISLVGIGSGLVVLQGLLHAKRPDWWTTLFLSTTVATSVTGFLFPFVRFLPSHAFGIISLVLLAVAIYALYRRQLAGAWARVYIVTSVTALYLNVFVLIVQIFQKTPPLRALAPTQSEPPFLAAQLLALVLFVLLGTRAARKFQLAPQRAV